MDTRLFLIIFLVFLLLCSLGALGFLYFQVLNRPSQPIALPMIPPSQVTPTPVIQEPAKMEITLYFLSEDNSQLIAETRTISSPDTIPDRIRKALEELIAGPTGGNLLNPIPPDTQLQSVFWNEAEGRIYLSFSEEIFKKSPGHTLSEWATLYSIINTTADQSPSVKEVQILVNGEVASNAYTVWDWTYPFQPDKTFVLNK